jgi:hypothetical protein
MSEGLQFRIEWLDAPGVSTPELAATWARYEVWVAGRCVSQVEAVDGTFRRSVFGSMYPLAEWIGTNWWVLTSNIRPSAIDPLYWTWPNVPTDPWLHQHNVRGTGDGMAWPDMTIVMEGNVARVVYMSETEQSLARIRFATEGRALVRAEDVRQGLAAVVDHVLERLATMGIRETRLEEEWTAVAQADDDEREFCQTVARLGLDPYSVDKETAAQVIEIASSLPADLVADFFDSADPAALSSATIWTRRAMQTAENVSTLANEELSPLYEAASAVTDQAGTIERPWTMGYAMARRVRAELDIRDTDPVDPSRWVGLGEVNAPASGIQGAAAAHANRCGLVLGSPDLGGSARRFGEARALGRVLARPQQRIFMLSAARGYNERLARAFAAELLAPAEGIREYLDVLGEHTDAAFDAVAGRYDVSPLLIRHQYDNQLAGHTDGAVW